MRPGLSTALTRRGILPQKRPRRLLRGVPGLRLASRTPAEAALPRDGAVGARLVLAGLAAFAILWPVFHLWGLRHTNHDDNAFGIAAWNPAMSWLEYARFTAEAQRRVQAFLGMPVSLAGNWLAAFPGASLVLAGQAGLCLGLFLWAFRGLLPARMLVLVAFGLATCFAVHFYFTAPPGYALIGLFWPMAFLLGAGLLRGALDRGAFLPWGALACWLPLCFGPEYNMILFGVPLLLLVWTAEAGLRTRLRYSLGFAAVGAFFVAVYLAYRMQFPDGVEAERLAPSLGAGWWETVGLLAGKALLPSAMTIGTDLLLSPVPGTPALPRLLDWDWLLAVLQQDRWYAAALLGFAGAFCFLLGGPRAGRRGRWLLVASALVFLVVPVAMVSVSATYQRIVPAGYLQGHLASAFVQAGAIALLLGLLGGRGWPWPARLIVALPFAALATMTLAYNLAMRDAMSANRQKWTAFALLAEAAPPGRVHAPSFWWENAVAAPAAQFHPASGPYWDDVARYMLGSPLLLRGANEAARQGDPEAGFMVSPDDNPVVWLKRDGAVVLIARRPAAILLRGRDVPPGAWRCDTLCRLPVEGVDTAAPGWLRPGVQGVSTLPARLLLGRNGAFGAW